MPRLQSRIDFDGAIITVRIELSVSEEALFRAMGRPVPPPFPTTALIDTGASHTAVYPMILDHLRAVSTVRDCMNVPGQPEADRSLDRVRFSLGNFQAAFEVQVAKIAPATNTVAVLIGCDILEHGTLLFDGQNETSSFWF